MFDLKIYQSILEYYMKCLINIEINYRIYRSNFVFPERMNTNKTISHSKVDCPEGFFHLYNDTTKACVCFEDNTAYFGNNHRFGAENPQFDRLGCQRSCEAHPECKYWTFSKPSVAGEEGLCYLKTKRENMKFNLTDYVSGTKHCRLPEWQG